MENIKYIKKFVWLPYGKKMTQIFSLENGIVKTVICFNEHVQKSFLVTELFGIKYFVSEFDIPSSKKEYLDFESYL